VAAKRTEFNVLLKEFVTLFKDGHVNLMTNWNNLPGSLQVAYLGVVGEHLFQDDKDVFYVRDLLPAVKVKPEGFPLKVGDKIVKLDGAPVEEFAKKHCPQDVGNELANKTIRFKNLKLFVSSLCLIPKGESVSVSFLRGTKEMTETVFWTKKDYHEFLDEQRKAEKELPKEEEKESDADQLSVGGQLNQWLRSRYHWDHQEFFSNLLAHKGESLADVARDQFMVQVPTADLYLAHLESLSVGKEAVPSDDEEEDGDDDDKKDEEENSALSSLDVENKFFEAKVFFSGDKKVGYVKIPSFSGSKDHTNAFKELLENFKKLNVDAKVLDLVDNGGGSLTYGTDLANLLKTEDSKEVGIQIRLNANWVDGIHSSSLFNKSDYLRSHFSRVYSKLSGERESEKLSSTFPIRELFPLLDKPSAKEKQSVVVMINEMCASMCDIFSADLKDNGVAKIIGTQSMGAGGNVTPHAASPILGNILTTTESLIVRSTGELLENKGVVPDKEYRKTLSDLTAENKDFIAAAIEYSLEK
jgi:C-terminal processing protease CtpA/Prc